MSASIWTPGSNNIPVANPNAQLQSELFTATEGQTLFTLTQYTYHTNGGALAVYVNGAKLQANKVVETSESSFTLVNPTDAGDIVEAVGNTEMANASSAAQIASDAAVEAMGYRDDAQTAANTATTQAGLASTAKTDAEAASAAAIAVYDSFDDRFLGVKASAPSVDNDGNALVTGAMYWNSGSNAMFLWSGAAWQLITYNAAPQTLTDAATINWDWSLGNAIVSISTNRTLGNPTGMADGDYRTLRVARTGSWSINAWGSKFRGKNWIIQSTSTGLVDHFTFRYNSVADIFELVGFRSNIAEA